MIPNLFCLLQERSCSRFFAGSAHSYMVLQERRSQWKSLDGAVYHTESL